MQGDTTTRQLRRRMVVALARATRARDHSAATALRSTIAVLAHAEAVRGGLLTRDPAAQAARAGLDADEVAALVTAQAERRERATECYEQSGDLPRAHRMLDEAEVLRAFLDD